VSIRLRLVLWQTLLLGLVLAAFAVVVYATVERQETSRLEAELRVAADNVRQAYYDARGKTRDGPPGDRAAYGPAGEAAASPAAPDRDRGDRGDRDGDDGDDAPPPAVANPAITAAVEDAGFVAQVVTAGGEVRAWSSNRAAPLPIPGQTLAEIFGGRGQQQLVGLTVDGEAFEVYGDPAPARFGDGAAEAVVVAAPRAAIDATLGRWRLLLGAAVLGTTAAAAAVGWFLASQAMRPVDRMTRAARAIGDAADFGRRLPEPPRQDELGRLALTFNRMLGQLGEAFANQKRFLADASHELRTPLTVVRTNTETLLRGGAADPAEREAALRAIARESERMGRLVGDLLTLARADAGQPLVRRRFPLDTLALEVYQHGRTLANGRQVALDDWEQVEVEGDADRLKQVMLNLVDNAIRHTPADGVVTLDLLRRGGEAVFRVRDTGPGIAPEHLGRIFERFYRVDQPRTRQSGGGGSGTGLGLAIAREAAEAHGGRIEVESRPGAGSVFSLVLPIAPPPGDPAPVQTAAATPRPATAP